MSDIRGNSYGEDHIYGKRKGKVEFFVLEQTKIGGTNYILVTDMEDGDGDALILKDLSKPEEKDGLYEIVSEEKELSAVAAVFETLMDDVTFVSDDE